MRGLPMNFTHLRHAIACAFLTVVLTACGGGGGGGIGGGSGNSPPRFTSPTFFTFKENQVVMFTLEVADADGDTIVIRDDQSGDGRHFSVNPQSGLVAAITQSGGFDFEAPIDVNGDNVYEQRVTLSDGKTTVSQIIKVTIEDVDEPPVLTGATTFYLNENETGPLFQLIAEDPEGAAVSDFRIEFVSQVYGRQSRTLADSFSVDAQTGVITINQAFDAERENTQTPIVLVIEFSDGRFVVREVVEIWLVDLPSLVLDGVRITGVKGSEPLGDYMMPLGDIDGDGLEDFWITKLISRPALSPKQETAWLIWGKTIRDLNSSGATSLNTSNLTASQAIRFTNETYSVPGAKRTQLIAVPAGDVDGDGQPDILIGFRDPRTMEWEIPDEEDGPVAAVVFGRALRGNLSGHHDLLSPSPGSQINLGGLSRHAALKLHLTAGDFDGDRYTDLVLSMPRTGGPRVVFGADVNAARNAGFLDLGPADSALLLRRYTEFPFEVSERGLGPAVSVLNDIDGDGLDELLLALTSGPSHDIYLDQSGVVVLPGDVLSAAQGAGLAELNLLDMPASDRVVTLSGDIGSVQAISVNGDVDADGIRDVLLSHDDDHRLGRVGTLIYGAAIRTALATNSAFTLNFADTTRGAIIELTSWFDPPFDPYVSGIPQISEQTGYYPLLNFVPNLADGPGDEIIAGWPGYAALGRSYSGAIFLIPDGAITGAPQPTISLLDPNMNVVNGRKLQGMSFGSAIGGMMFAADLDADGIADLSVVSNLAGPKSEPEDNPFSPFPEVSPLGAYYMLPGTILQKVLNGSRTDYDLAESWEVELP